MSWNVTAIGKPPAVAKSLAADFNRSKCIEPEETIKNTIRDIVKLALESYSPGVAVRVEASGSQSDNSNTLNVKIEPIWGFVE